jgi:tRNA dimethylallyltransferase
VITALRGRGAPVVLTGGTGLYLRAALGGLFGEPEPDAPPHEASAAELTGTRRLVRSTLARRWEAEGAEALHAELARVDPGLARALHPRDRQRVLRGLEFHAASGRPLSVARRTATSSRSVALEKPAPRADRAAAPAPRGEALRALRIRLELDPEANDLRIARRVERMLEAGLLEEGRALLDRYGGALPPGSSALGYPEVLRHLRGELSLDEGLRGIVTRTRQYAKRQRTWFRHQDAYEPVPAGERAFFHILAAWRERLP